MVYELESDLNDSIEALWEIIFSIIQGAFANPLSKCWQSLNLRCLATALQFPYFLQRPSLNESNHGRCHLCVLMVMSAFRNYPNDAMVQKNACKVLSCLTEQCPCIASLAIEEGCFNKVIEAMKVSGGDAGVQAAGCAALLALLSDAGRERFDIASTPDAVDVVATAMSMVDEDSSAYHSGCKLLGVLTVQSAHHATHTNRCAHRNGGTSGHDNENGFSLTCGGTFSSTQGTRCS